MRLTLERVREGSLEFVIRWLPCKQHIMNSETHLEDIRRGFLLQHNTFHFQNFQSYQYSGRHSFAVLRRHKSFLLYRMVISKLSHSQLLRKCEPRVTSFLHLCNLHLTNWEFSKPDWERAPSNQNKFSPEQNIVAAKLGSKYILSFTSKPHSIASESFICENVIVAKHSRAKLISLFCRAWINLAKY